MYKEWVTKDDKDCSIILIKLRISRKKKRNRNLYYFVITIKNTTLLLLISMFIYKHALLIKSLRLTAKPRYLLLHRGKKRSHPCPNYHLA